MKKNRKLKNRFRAKVDQSYYFDLKECLDIVMPAVILYLKNKGVTLVYSTQQGVKILYRRTALTKLIAAIIDNMLIFNAKNATNEIFIGISSAPKTLTVEGFNAKFVTYFK